MSEAVKFPAGMPKYLHLANVLREAITSGEGGGRSIQMGDDHLMDRYSVSRATARQAVNMLVREGLVVREQGRGTFVKWKPGRTSEFLVEAVGWSFEAIVENRYVRDVVMGIEQACEAADAQFRLYPIREESLVSNGLMEDLRNSGKRAGVVLLWPYPAHEITELVRNGIAVVSANMDYTKHGAGSVVTNSEAWETVGTLLKRLGELGHRRVGFMVSRQLSLPKQIGQAGSYEVGVLRHHLEADRRLLKSVDEDKESVREALEELLALDEPPTAVLAGNEPILEGVIEAAEKAGVPVPEAMSLGGFTTVDFDDFYTAMRLDQRALGRQAAEMLLGMLEKPGAAGEKKVIEVEYHEGGSFGTPSEGVLKTGTRESKEGKR